MSDLTIGYPVPCNLYPERWYSCVDARESVARSENVMRWARQGPPAHGEKWRGGVLMPNWDRTRTRLYTISDSCSRVMLRNVIAGVYSNTFGNGFSTVEER